MPKRDANAPEWEPLDPRTARLIEQAFTDLPKRRRKVQVNASGTPAPRVDPFSSGSPFALLAGAAQKAAAGAGLILYETEDGRRGAVRPQRVRGHHPHGGAFAGNPSAAQKAYLYCARAALLDADASAVADVAEDVRRSIGAPMILRKPNYVISSDLGPYYWFEGIQQVLADGKWSMEAEPFPSIWRAARSFLWNKMRDEDRRTVPYLPLLGEGGLVIPRPERMELIWDVERVLERLERNREFRQMIEIIRRTADGETAILNRRGQRTLLEFKRRFPHPLKQMWEELGGYYQQHRQIAFDERMGLRVESRDHCREKSK